MQADVLRVITAAASSNVVYKKRRSTYMNGIEHPDISHAMLTGYPRGRVQPSDYEEEYDDIDTDEGEDE